MTASVLFGKKGAKIGLLQLDATVSENHSYRNEVSEWPVEDGSTIIDNIRLVPERLSISGLISNFPIDVRFQDVTNIVEGNSNTSENRIVSREDTATRVETAQNILLRIAGRVIQGKTVRPEIITIVTGLRVYTNMAITDLKINRDRRTGQALPFTADFIEVKTSEILVIAPKPQEAFTDKASTKKGKGKQKSLTASETTENKTSVAKSAFNAAGRFVSKLLPS